MPVDVPVDLRFFQAAATAIPTLLVALVVAAKWLDEPDEGPEDWQGVSQFDKMIDALRRLGVAVGLAAGEMVALYVLATGHGDSWQAQIVASVIALLIGLIFIQVSWPRWNRMGISPTRLSLLMGIIILGAFASGYIWSYYVRQG